MTPWLTAPLNYKQNINPLTTAKTTVHYFQVIFPKNRGCNVKGLKAKRGLDKPQNTGLLE